MQVAQAWFWSIANNFPNLVSHFHVQIRLKGNCGLNCGIPLLYNTDGALSLFSARRVSNMSVIYSLIAQNSKMILNLCGLIWTRKSYLPTLSMGPKLPNSFNSLDRLQKVLLLLGGTLCPL